MRLFLEIERRPTEEEMSKGIPIPFARVPVSSEEEARGHIPVLLAYIAGGEAYLHICRHDETPQGPCEKKKL